MPDINTKVFLKINAPVGKSKLLDAFGRAGAEWAILAMLGWYVAGVFINGLPEKWLILPPLVFFVASWCVGWLIGLGMAINLREPRPHVNSTQVKLLFSPLMSWKSFPSDHSMSAGLLVFLSFIFNLPGAWATIPMALWVMWGRVYAGLHYPLDVLGGVSVALFASAVSYYIVKML
ncbi:MAG: PAP2 superfamily protein [Candidatus Magasanikbacteria bacterium GW2011_GWA2_56_11]|uniref:PAP2 superfamily protein n=1 Tax=Candidatus Magasanikbacteria bacterium GW2011_GWA2_56_11 TaxID=1619044 RepID=A0A0G2ALW0_9BACT|nr:MAG: PAP2 superfamily protein [Candidatus Magasanikbacteria bacterium GW2011_GWA2_56_11]